jgi:Family of unknown function (DUF6982)
LARFKVVARFSNGRVLKGLTGDFVPTKPSFRLIPSDAEGAEKPIEIQVAELKALFFVKELRSKPHIYPHRQQFDPKKPAAGRKIRVVFLDGEIMTGTTQSYDPRRAGFFVFPADDASNNERCFIVAGAIKELTFL